MCDPNICWMNKGLWKYSVNWECQPHISCCHKWVVAQHPVNPCVINIKYLKVKQIRNFEFKCNINMKAVKNELYIMYFSFPKQSDLRLVNAAFKRR